MKTQRRIFLKVVATGPLVACGGAVSTPLEGEVASGGVPGGGSAGMPGGGSAGAPGGGRAGTAEGGGSAGKPSGGSAGHGGASVMTNPGTPAGNVSSLMIGSLVVSGSFIIGRDAQGVYAMSIACTHQGCSVMPSSNGLYCPCHGSRFDSNGAVVQGPARTPLPHYAVLVDSAGNITVQTTVVSASTRTAVA